MQADLLGFLIGRLMENRLLVSVANDGDGIYIMDTDGQNARRISPLGIWSGHPAWSPDGKWIAYDAYDAGIANPWENPNVAKHIFIVSVTGGRATANHTTSWAT